MSRLEIMLTHEPQARDGEFYCGSCGLLPTISDNAWEVFATHLDEVMP
ncbi:hypothetical protein [Tsukamurella tyrosinosolvens]